MVRLLVCASVLVCSDVAPAAHSLFLQPTLEFGKDSMETQCLPLGRAFLTTRYREFRIVQTPALIMFAFNDGMHREFALSSNKAVVDPRTDRARVSVCRRRGPQRD